MYAAGRQAVFSSVRVMGGRAAKGPGSGSPGRGGGGKRMLTEYGASARSIPAWNVTPPKGRYESSVRLKMSLLLDLEEEGAEPEVEAIHSVRRDGVELERDR